jgi:uncharacterized protein YbjT (DUF2867 family)
MKILLTGATGFIGSAVAGALRAQGDTVVALGHLERAGGERQARLEAMTETDWRELLSGVDAVINCAGIFGDTATARVEAINHKAAVTLFRACADAGVRRVLQLSALGVSDGLTPFARSKLAADTALMATELDWVILRPSIVFGDDAGGGSALLRGLAALPLLPLDRTAGELQIVQLDDVVETIVRLTRPDAPARLTLDLVGPERLSFTQSVRAIRSWLRRTPAAVIVLPDWLMTIGYALGDLAGWLGWKTPVRLSARRELRRGAVGDHRPWAEATGVQPQGLRAALAAKPSTAQERGYASLYFLQPLVIGVTALFFIATGIASISIGYAIGVSLLERGGVGALSGPAVIGGGLADLVAGLLIAWRPTARCQCFIWLQARFSCRVSGATRSGRCSRFFRW